MERENNFFFPFLTVHLDAFALGETRPEGLANTHTHKKRVGQQEQRIAVAALTHMALCAFAQGP